MSRDVLEILDARLSAMAEGIRAMKEAMADGQIDLDAHWARDMGDVDVCHGCGHRWPCAVERMRRSAEVLSQ